VSWPWNVDILADSFTLSNVEVVTLRTIGIEFSILVDMQRYVENVGIALEGILNAVTMVHVPIENQNLPALVGEVVLAHFGRNTNIVEETETARLIVFCMMSRWANDCYGILDLAGYYRAAGFNGSTS
jgi:hypothetical protein